VRVRPVKPVFMAAGGVAGADYLRGVLLMSDLRNLDVTASATQWMASSIVLFRGNLPRPYGYWTRERCIEDAKRFTSRNKWDRNSRGAFQAARRNGWMDDCMPRGGR
jgi:hypothetical protein